MTSRRLHWTEHAHPWKKIVNPTEPEGFRNCFVNKLDPENKWCLVNSANGAYWGNPQTGESSWEAKEEWFLNSKGTRLQQLIQDFMHVSHEDKIIALVLFIILVTIITLMGRTAAYFNEAIKGNPFFYDSFDRRMFQEAAHLAMQILLFLIFCGPSYLLYKIMLKMYFQLYPSSVNSY